MQTQANKNGATQSLDQLLRSARLPILLYDQPSEEHANNVSEREYGVHDCPQHCELCPQRQACIGVYELGRNSKRKMAVFGFHTSTATLSTNAFLADVGMAVVGGSVPGSLLRKSEIPSQTR